MNRFIIFFLLLLCLLIYFSFRAHAAVQVSYVYDGDTVKVTDGKYTYKLRITHIDAPERNQPYGKKARRALMQLCTDASAKVNIVGIDQYQRKLGSLICNENDVASFMVSNGHAWFNSHYSSDLALALKERTARESKLGLWQNEKPTAPWVWRQQNKQPQPT